MVVRGIPERGSAAQETMWCIDRSGLTGNATAEPGNEGERQTDAALASSAHETINSATCARQVSAIMTYYFLLHD